MGVKPHSRFLWLFFSWMKCCCSEQSFKTTPKLMNFCCHSLRSCCSQFFIACSQRSSFMGFYEYRTVPSHPAELELTSKRQLLANSFYVGIGLAAMCCPQPCCPWRTRCVFSEWHWRHAALWMAF